MSERGESRIGAAWAMPGVKYIKQDLVDYLFDVNRAGGLVSIDVLLFRDGSLDRSQLETLKALRPGLAAAKSPAPVPPGNLAFRKPARLLILDGSHELEVNGGGGPRFPKCGVDGRLDTSALAAAADQNGQPYALEFAPVQCQFVRVSAVKPDGPNQKGAQMAIAELEVYE